MAGDFALDIVKHILSQTMVAEEGKWISVKNRLPEDDNHVLTHGIDGVQEGYYDDGEWKIIVKAMYLGETDYTMGTEVYNWMPMVKKPQPPKDKDAGGEG